MRLIEIVRDEQGGITLVHADNTREEAIARIDELKTRLETTWFGVASALGMPANENSCRVIRRWRANPQSTNFRPMPLDKYRFLLGLLDRLRAEADPSYRDFWVKPE
ncbi:hypothetical protein [Ferrimonas marina]|uniref:Uncharacterized protein n=1 Tax=Ferrimonas marina TaxID=299255 RepID=A0A1M5ZG62_9GAMM|nr:hypothetical protein [Ferrimonas marina]SHI23121.1 hypothetical protein SAMN02745129_0253 [Ferrimonas marina]